MGNYMSNQLSYRHTQRVMVGSAMAAGGCSTEFRLARKCCARRKKTNAEVYDCIFWTSHLRWCMEGKNCHLKNYVKLMEEGVDQDEGKKRRDESHESEEERWRWRWWTGMIRVPEQPPASNKKNPYEFY